VDGPHCRECTAWASAARAAFGAKDTVLRVVHVALHKAQHGVPPLDRGSPPDHHAFLQGVQAAVTAECQRVGVVDPAEATEGVLCVTPPACHPPGHSSAARGTNAELLELCTAAATAKGSEVVHAPGASAQSLAAWWTAGGPPPCWLPCGGDASSGPTQHFPQPAGAFRPPPPAGGTSAQGALDTVNAAAWSAWWTTQQLGVQETCTLHVVPSASPTPWWNTVEATGVAAAAAAVSRSQPGACTRQ